MNLNRTGSIWDRSERVKINDNWDLIEQFILTNGESLFDTQTFKDWLYNNSFKPRKAVEHVNDLPSNANERDIIGVKSNNTIYIYTDGNWVEFSSFDFQDLKDTKNEIENKIGDITQLETKLTKNFNNIKIHGYFPFRFKGYQDLINQTGASYFYPQGLALDDEYFYLLYDASGFTKRLLVIYDKSFNFVRKYFVGTHGGENIHVQKESDGKRYLYAKSEILKLGKYDITKITASNSTEDLLPVKEFNIPLYTNFFKTMEGWGVEYRNMISETNNILNRNTLLFYNDNFSSLQGTLNMDPASSLLHGGYTNTEITKKATKKQGMALYNTSIFQSVGGQWNPTRDLQVDVYHLQGLQEIGPGGEVINNYTHSPKEYFKLFQGLGKNPEIVEHESLYVHDSKVYALVIYKDAFGKEVDEHGIALIEYGAVLSDFVFSNVSSPYTTPTAHYNPFKVNVNKKLVNEYTGRALHTLNELIIYMSETFQKRVTFYTTGLEMLDENNQQIKDSFEVTVTNQNNYTFFVEYKNKDRNYIIAAILDLTNNAINYINPNEQLEVKNGLDLLSIDYNTEFYSIGSINSPSSASGSGFVKVEVRPGGIRRVEYKPYNTYDVFLNIRTDGSWKGWKKISL